MYDIDKVASNCSIPDGINRHINCHNYLSPKQIRFLMSKPKAKNDLLMVHFNTRSLPKNKELVEEFINEIK